MWPQTDKQARGLAAFSVQAEEFIFLQERTVEQYSGAQAVS
jgi:hypothetical protein